MADTELTITTKQGEVITVGGARGFKPPSQKSLTPIAQAAGANPPAINLKDHPELNGTEIQIVAVEFTSGEAGGKKTTFMVAAAYVVAPGAQATEKDFRVIMTGADNVMARVMEAKAKNALPIKGILRKAGRAWFLD